MRDNVEAESRRFFVIPRAAMNDTFFCWVLLEGIHSLALRACMHDERVFGLQARSASE